MKKSFYSLLIAAVFSLGSLCAYGAEATAQAIVLKVKGSANAVFAGQTQPVAIKVGDKLPQGATIVTGPDSEVDVQAFNGAVATIKAGSTVSLEKLSITTAGGAVTKQSALLNLKVGGIVSNIDPANHNINDYGIRTPKGVAAARGTVYTVLVSAGGAVQVFVTQSTIVFTDINGRQVIVEAGFQVSVNPDGTISPPVKITETNPAPEGATTITVDTEVIVSPAQ
ncbi:MAG: FecR domain-containing protein [Opitutaceae bacterium]